jgi:choline dehydrogenase-like flavoprotein
MSEHPVVILGAGPAGSAAARLLTTWGHDVVVLGRRPTSDRALAESLPPSGVALLERMGFTGLDATGAVRATGNTVRWGNDDERVEQFAEGLHGYQVDRPAFDAFLAREATAAGADVRLGANVIRVAEHAVTYSTARAAPALSPGTGGVWPTTRHGRWRSSASGNATTRGQRRIRRTPSLKARPMGGPGRCPFPTNDGLSHSCSIRGSHRCHRETS